MPPQPRQHSKLRSRHPAEPENPTPSAEEENRSSEQVYARTRARTDVLASEGADTSTSTPADTGTSAPADTLTHGTANTAAFVPADAHSGWSLSAGPTAHADTHALSVPQVAVDDSELARYEQLQQQKAIRDAGYAWAASLSRYTQRTKSWASAITAARLAGTPPAILRTLIEEAAHRAQAAPEAVPAQVWQAAGLAPPEHR